MKIQFLVGRLTAMGYNYVTKQKQIPQAGNYRNKEEKQKNNLQTTTPSYTYTAY